MDKQDYVPAPNILNALRIGKFEMRIIAYRKLTLEECQAVAAQWLKSSKRKSFPVSGTVTINSMIGFVP